MKTIENWTELTRNKTIDGFERVLYELNGYKVMVIDDPRQPGEYSISVWPFDYTVENPLPEIYITEPCGCGYQIIEIPTISRGALSLDKFEQLLAAYCAALETAEEIKRAFPECFVK